MARGRATLDTVARHLGVSKMTVSNAYNHPDQLSPQLRQRVLEAARQLGYPGPDPLASTLRRGRTATVGLVFDDPLSFAFTDPAAVVFLQGMARVCETKNIGLLLVPGGAADVVRTALVDGVAVYSDFEADERVAVLRERRLPYVLVDARPAPDVPWVGIDDLGGARAAARHLLDLGHRRFGVLSLCNGNDGYVGWVTPERQRAGGYYVTSQRLAGYRAALVEAGLDWAHVPIYEHQRADWGDAGYRAAPHLLDRAERPTAILAMSDELARGALRAARERGIDVPRELSIVGFDDSPEAARSSPALTTVRQPLEHKGATAARLLLEPEASATRHIQLPTRLVVRASTAPAPR
jgi:DNA-binding LacI/PurR family transcriptional regulator